MINGVLGQARELGWPSQNLHSEEFLAPPPGSPFKAIFKKSGKAIEVHSHQSILEAAEAAGIDAPYLCRGGACGQCETGVISCQGHIEHNDNYLEAPEKASGNALRQVVQVKQGIEQTLAKDIVRSIKDSKLKVQVSIQGDELRVSGKKRDDLQTAIQHVREMKIQQPLQYVNFRD